MTQAAKLLRENYRVNEVALMVGYEDTNRFSQAFKQFHGVSPSVYK
jgi:AraC-like DNA-binding protein